jgi:hypothetical protein
MRKCVLLGLFMVGMVVGFQAFFVTKACAELDLGMVQSGVDTAGDVNNLINTGSGGSGGGSNLQKIIKTVTKWATVILLAIVSILIGINAMKLANGHREAMGQLIMGIIAAVIIGSLPWLVPFLINIGLKGQ